MLVLMCRVLLVGVGLGLLVVRVVWVVSRW